MILVYVAHAYGGDPANLARARRWLTWAWRKHIGTHGFMAPWIDACEAVPETQANREAGLAFDCECVALCDEMWLVEDG